MPRPVGVKSRTVREPLAFSLGSKSKVASLRTLCAAREMLTQREVARRCRLQHRTVQLALDELVALGVVSRSKGQRDSLVSMNRRHYLATPLCTLFESEDLYFTLLRRELRNAVLGDFLEHRPLSLVASGSAVVGSDRPEGELRVLVISKSVADAHDAVSRLEDERAEIEAMFGVELHPTGFSVRQARPLWRQRQAPFADAHRGHSWLLMGKPLRTVLG